MNLKTNVKLSDLVALNMKGKARKFLLCVLRGAEEEADELIANIRDETSFPEVYNAIVNHAVRSVFEEPMAALREAVQNSLDAYDNGAPKKVALETQEGPVKKNGRSDLLLRVQDSGCGMSWVDVLNDLLTPYNSSKKGKEKRGKHGIGAFSLLDLAEELDVYTGKNHVVHVSVTKENGDWTADMETYAGQNKGTLIVAKLKDVENGTEAVQDALDKYAGFVDPEGAEITLNGKKVNNKAKRYELVGTAPVHIDGKKSQLKLYVKKAEKGKMNLGHYVTWTHEGLWMRNDNKIIDNEDAEFLKKLDQGLWAAGVKFWADLPMNASLTKDRHYPTAEYDAVVYNATVEAFEQALFNFFLEDRELVKKLDTRLSDIVEYHLEGIYKDNKCRRRQVEVPARASPVIPKTSSAVPEAVSAAIEHNAITMQDAPPPEPETRYCGVDHFSYFTDETAVPPERVEVVNEAKRKISNMHSFARNLMEKQFVPAQRRVGGKGTDVKVSINDMIEAYARNVLFDSAGEVENRDGIWVNSSDKVVGTVFRYIGGKKAEDESPKERMSVVIYATPSDIVRKVVESEGRGHEYKAFVECMEYIDDLVSKANDMEASSVMIRKIAPERNVAASKLSMIAYNLSNRRVRKMIDAVWKKDVDADTLMAMVDVHIHEKTHQKRGEYDMKAMHGKGFYEQDKPEMRDRFIRYCRQSGIDPMEKVKTILDGYQFMKRTSPDYMGALIDIQTKREKKP